MLHTSLWLIYIENSHYYSKLLQYRFKEYSEPEADVKGARQIFDLRNRETLEVNPKVKRNALF